MLNSADEIQSLKAYLDPICEQFESTAFIADDPISIPHAFQDPRDQEIIGLFAALLAWGRRDIMLSKLGELCERMSFTPYTFVQRFRPSEDRKKIEGFVHRTFNATDLEGLILSLQALLAKHSLEHVFSHGSHGDNPVSTGLEHLSDQLFTHVPGQPTRMRKHLARPSTGSACKRLNMFLRWMVRTGPVDLGIWSCINKKDLLLPLDVHSGTQARNIGLLVRKANDWKSVLELSGACQTLDPSDPCKYDFALFGSGAAGQDLVLPKSR